MEVSKGKSEMEGDEDTPIRATPQAFSHFTYVFTSGNKMVVDIQGVGDLFTDPQIHTIDQSGYGLGNGGADGMAAFFQTHRCNLVCRKLNLPLFDLCIAERDVLTSASLATGGTGASGSYFDDIDLSEDVWTPATNINLPRGPRIAVTVMLLASLEQNVFHSLPGNVLGRILEFIYIAHTVKLDALEAYMKADGGHLIGEEDLVQSDIPDLQLLEVIEAPTTLQRNLGITHNATAMICMGSYFVAGLYHLIRAAVFGHEQSMKSLRMIQESTAAPVERHEATVSVQENDSRAMASGTPPTASPSRRMNVLSRSLDHDLLIGTRPALRVPVVAGRMERRLSHAALATAPRLVTRPVSPNSVTTSPALSDPPVRNPLARSTSACTIMCNPKMDPSSEDETPTSSLVSSFVISQLEANVAPSRTRGNGGRRGRGLSPQLTPTSAAAVTFDLERSAAPPRQRDLARQLDEVRQQLARRDAHVDALVEHVAELKQEAAITRREMQRMGAQLADLVSATGAANSPPHPPPMAFQPSGRSFQVAPGSGDLPPKSPGRARFAPAPPLAVACGSGEVVEEASKGVQEGWGPVPRAGQRARALGVPNAASPASDVHDGKDTVCSPRSTASVLQPSPPSSAPASPRVDNVRTPADEHELYRAEVQRLRSEVIMSRCDQKELHDVLAAVLGDCSNAQVQVRHSNPFIFTNESSQWSPQRGPEINELDPSHFEAHRRRERRQRLARLDHLLQAYKNKES